MVTVSLLPMARLQNGFQVAPLGASRVVHLGVLPAVAQVQIQVPALQAPPKVVQEALPVALPGELQDFRNRLGVNKTLTPSPLPPAPSFSLLRSIAHPRATSTELDQIR